MTSVLLRPCFGFGVGMTSTRRRKQNLLQSRHSLLRLLASVTGPVYTDNDPESPTVTLYTKEGCTLCDKAKDVLFALKDQHPHSLQQVDITDREHREWWDRYKYDIPVLHINDMYWTKHRLTTDDVTKALMQAKDGMFQPQSGQPNAAAMERNKE
ncbi:glutaredoxin [Nitzschia inconspicua]|uniref:Glutaredoxin-like protein n=1 Tax=Nitzschia inconspicua TaxID=303405 RepID=A0A9K3KS51_9STRA|nr:glutaredoxin [Nitzschia inconspicua]